MTNYPIIQNWYYVPWNSMSPEFPHYVDDWEYTSGASDYFVHYQYDAFNRLVGETVCGDGKTQHTVYVYQGNQIVAQFDNSGGNLAATDLSHRYLWNPQAAEQLALVLAELDHAQPQHAAAFVHLDAQRLSLGAQLVQEPRVEDEAVALGVAEPREHLEVGDSAGPSPKIRPLDEFAPPSATEPDSSPAARRRPSRGWATASGCRHKACSGSPSDAARIVRFVPRRSYPTSFPQSRECAASDDPLRSRGRAIHHKRKGCVAHTGGREWAVIDVRKMTAKKNCEPSQEGTRPVLLFWLST